MPEVSHNQLVTTLIKACLGAGVTRGVAEDVALALAGLKGNDLKESITELCDALDRFEKESAIPAKPEQRGDTATISKAILLHHGPSLVELAATLSDEGKMLLVEQVDCPNCLQALAKAANLTGNIEKTPSGHLFAFEGAGKQSAPLPTPTRTQIDRTLWAKLLQHAHATMVPSDAASQADAGAGDSDND